MLKAREEFRSGKSVFDMTLRVVYYARVSTEKDEQLNSLENQKNYFEDYISNSKHWKLVGRYIDEGISATSIKGRKNFMKMIEDAVSGKFDMILTKEVSRFARNTVDSIQYTNYLLENGVIVNFLNDNLNTIDETCEFRLTIMSSLAQDEVRKLSSRVKFGLERSVKDGRVLGGGNITGYHKEKGKLTINEEEAPMVRMLFDLYSSGKYGFRTISEKLFQAGYKNTKGGYFADKVLSRILRNPKYKGYYCGNISYIEDYKTHKKVYRPRSEWVIYKDPNIPAIVSEEVWDRANNIYDEKQSKLAGFVSKRNYYNDSYTYTGKLICKEHGCGFTRIGSGGRTKNPVWQCTEYARGGLKRCETPTLYEKQLDVIFKNIMKEFVQDKEKILELILNDYKKFMNENGDEKKKRQLLDRKSKLNKLKNKILELSLDGGLTNLEFKNRNDEYNRELEIINKELHFLSDTNKSTEILNEKLKNLRSVLSKYIELDNSLKDWIDLIIDKIYVSKVNNDRKHVKLEIMFKYGLENYSLVKDFNKPPKKSNYDKHQENREALQSLIPDSNRARSQCYGSSTNNRRKCCN